MKKKLFLFSILATLILTGSFPLAALADGIIIPGPPICDPGPCPGPVPMVQLEIRYHHVTVTIEDQVAITHVDQVFYNPNDWQVEGTYLFPIPQEAVVSNFTLWIDGEPVEGKVLDAEQARKTYEEIVRTMRDPALLEYAGRGAVQASIFPIPPKGERRVELEYTQVLVAENGLVQYVYPLNTEKYSLRPLESVRISVAVHSQIPVRAVYSPSHEIDISRESENAFKAGYEASYVLPDTDFALYYSLGEEQAFHLLTYRDPSDLTDPDGFFLALLAPRPDAGEQTLPKDVILVLDRSGSMDGEKFLQAQDALRYILRHLNPEDRFNIIAFSTGLEVYGRSMRPAAEAAEALPWVDRLNAQGSTDINRALLEAATLMDHERPTYLIFLTDGLPTEGETDSQKILNNLAASAPDELRLFAFGVGYDVDTFLLDSLSQEHHGTSTYVLPGERLDEVLSAFYAKINTPVLMNLALTFEGQAVYDVYPQPLPDLFAGSQIIVVGRYRQGGNGMVTLTGEVNNQNQIFRFPNQTFAVDSRDGLTTLQALPRLWATRKIGYLLNQIRLHGLEQETIDQIVHLSIRYGIVTPYTSYLVTEEMPLGVQAQEHIAQEQYDQLKAMPAAPVFGQNAVERAAGEGALSSAESAQAVPQEVSSQVRLAGSRTFVYSAGIWMDTVYDPEQMQPVEVSFLSQDYFNLIEARPDLAAAFALGQQVIVVTDGIAYQVVAEGEATLPVVIPPKLPSATPPSASAQLTPLAVAPSLTATPLTGGASQPVATPAGSGEMPCPTPLLSLGALGMVLFWRRRKLRS